MGILHMFRNYWLSAVVITSIAAAQGPTPTQAPSSTPAAQDSATGRDGQHDFDFLMGTWKVHLKQRTNPLAGPPQWVEMDGTNKSSRIWDGRANYDEFEAEGPTGHKESMTLRLYNPETRQWSLYWASSKQGVMQAPPMIGEFKNGRGEFYDGELFHDKQIYVRDVWSDITPNSCRFEQSFSQDGGKTWEANWIATFTRAGT
jgi:hypothetical protein